MNRLFSFVVMITIIAFTSCGSSSSDNPDDDFNKLKAYGYAEEFVKQKLKDPESATFPESSEKLKHIKHLGAFKYEIVSWVRAENSLGGTTKKEFTCVLRIDNENQKVYPDKVEID